MYCLIIDHLDRLAILRGQILIHLIEHGHVRIILLFRLVALVSDGRSDLLPMLVRLLNTTDRLLRPHLVIELERLFLFLIHHQVWVSLKRIVVAYLRSVL